METGDAATADGRFCLFLDYKVKIEGGVFLFSGVFVFLLHQSYTSSVHFEFQSWPCNKLQLRIFHFVVLEL